MSDLGWLAECIVLGISFFTIYLIWKCCKEEEEVESSTKKKLDEIFEDQTRCEE